MKFEVLTVLIILTRPMLLFLLFCRFFSKLAKAEFCSSEVFCSSAVLQFWSSYYYFSREQQALNIGHAAADGCLLMGPKKGDIFKI